MFIVLMNFNKTKKHCFGRGMYNGVALYKVPVIEIGAFVMQLEI